MSVGSAVVKTHISAVNVLQIQRQILDLERSDITGKPYLNLKSLLPQVAGYHVFWCLQLPSYRDEFNPAHITSKANEKKNTTKSDLNQFPFFVDVVLLQFFRLRSSSANWWPERNTFKRKDNQYV